MKYNFLFIHIPRCGGTSMSTALTAAFPQCFIGCDNIKHVRARYLRRLIGEDLWKKAYKFALIRSPWEIIESYWRHTTAAYDNIEFISHDSFWYSHVYEVHSYSGFDEYVERQYLTDPNINLREKCGFWQTFCMEDTNEDLGVIPVLTTRAADFFDGLCHLYHATPSFAYPHLNGANAPMGIWSKNLKERVGERCAYDTRRFGWTCM